MTIENVKNGEIKNKHKNCQFSIKKKGKLLSLIQSSILATCFDLPSPIVSLWLYETTRMKKKTSATGIEEHNILPHTLSHTDKCIIVAVQSIALYILSFTRVVMCCVCEHSLILKYTYIVWYNLYAALEGRIRK